MNFVFLILFIVEIVFPLEFRGICYGPFRTGWSELEESTIREDLTVFKNLGVNTIRTYGMSSGQDRIPPIAKNEFGFIVYAGAWVDNDDPSTSLEVELAINCTDEGDIIIVGNEHLYRTPEGDRSDEFDRLLSFFNTVRESGRKVAYADVDEIFTTYDLATNIDYLLLNTYSFWSPECTPVDAAQNVIDSYIDFKSLFEGEDVSVLIGETGWATSSCSICSAEIQAEFWKGMMEWASSVEERLFVFEAFDESWKDEGNHCSGTDFAKYFGIMDGERNNKEAVDEIKKFFLSDDDDDEDLGGVSKKLGIVWVISMFFVAILVDLV